MLIYLCATPRALAACLHAIQPEPPIGFLSAGHADQPEGLPDLDATVYVASHAPRPALGAPVASALAELQPCRVVLTDVGDDAEVNDLRTVRSIFQQLDAWDGTLVAGPRAVPLLGQLEDDPDHQAPVPETMLVASMRAAPDVAWLLRPNAPRRLLAFDGDVYVRYEPVKRHLTVHGAGSVLTVVIKRYKRSKADQAHANVLTPGMRLTW